MDKNKKSEQFKKEEEFLMKNYIGTASSGDCTGLIPSGSTDSSDEFDAYRDIYPFAVPSKKEEKERDSK